MLKPMPASITPDLLLDRLAATGALAIGPSARAATALRQRHTARQIAAGVPTWTPPRLLSWTEWTSSLWSTLLLEGADDRLLLNHAQEALLWQELIAATPELPPLTPARTLAELTQSAWALAAAWNATARLRTPAGTEDARLFARMAERFDTLCQERRYLPAAALDAALVPHIRRGTLPVPEPILLWGFGDLTPARSGLLTALTGAAASIEHLHLTAPCDAPPLRTWADLPDLRSEALFAARHLRTLLEQNPAARTALLVPGLDQETTQLEPILRDVLAPELADIARDPSGSPWTSSRNPPLSTVPLVRTLLDLARWTRTPLPVSAASAVLLSPFIAPEIPVERRARFDRRLSDHLTLLQPELHLRTAWTQARDVDSELAGWISGLLEIARDLSAQPLRRSYAEWTEALRRLGRAAGWPGTRALSALERAAVEAFDSILDLVATLDFHGSRVLFADALAAIEQQAAATPAPGPTPDPAVHVLTPAEAEGLCFDAVVLLRATDKNLPAPPRPHPLLDFALQRSLGMPGTSPARDIAATEDAFARLAASSTTLLLTSARQGNDGPQTPSRFALQLPRAPIPESTVDLAAGAAVVEEIVADDDPLPPLPAPEVAGGSAVLKLQAACGFLAFAELRLHAGESRPPEPGFDAGESGSLLHRALETFWNEVKSQDALRNLPEAERRSLLERCIDSAVTSLTRRAPAPEAWDLAYLAVLKERMCTVLLDWLRFELQRSPFTVIATERKEKLDIGPIRVDVRVDRIDRVTGPEGDGFVFIDYKTGQSAHPNAWIGPRPDEPQLPLYTLLGDAGSLRGLAFAKIRAGREMQWAGLTSAPGILPFKGSRSADLEAAVAEWRDTLEQLANEFADGHAAIAPKSPETNCKYCGQRLLCRVDLAALLAAPSAADGAENDTGTAFDE